MEEIDNNLPNLIAEFSAASKTLKEQFDIAKKQLEEKYKDMLAKEKEKLETKHASDVATLKRANRKPRTTTPVTPATDSAGTGASPIQGMLLPPPAAGTNATSLPGHEGNPAQTPEPEVK